MTESSQPRPGFAWSSPPMVGRDREMSLLRVAMEHANEGKGSLVLISGEAGIGKTSLVRELVTASRDSGFLILTGGAFELSATPPYGPWLDVVRDYPDSEGLPTLPRFITDRNTVAALGGQDQLHQAVLEFFIEVSQELPLLLVLEDIHWSDGPSLELLRFLSRNIENRRILIVATFRDDEPQEGNAFNKAILSIIRESAASRIELTTLDEHSIGSLVQRGYDLSETESKHLVRHLHHNTNGHPLFIVETLRTLQFEGKLSLIDNRWQVLEYEFETVPSLVQQMVRQRVATLSLEQRYALHVASVIGQIVPLDRWIRIVGDEIALSTVESALALHILNETENHRDVSFRHAIVRAAIYDDVGLPRRRMLHQIVAESYLEDPKPDPETVAYHLQIAGDDRTAKWLVRAGEQAERRFSWKEAFDRYDAAATLLREMGAQDTQLARLLVKNGRMLRFFDPRRGIAYHREARQIAKEQGGDVLAGFALFNEGNQLCMIGEPREGLEKMHAAIKTLADSDHNVASERWPSQTITNVEIQPLIASVGTLVAQLSYAGRFTDAIAMAEPYLNDDWYVIGSKVRAPEVDPESASFADGYWGLGIAHAALGNVRASERAFETASWFLKELNYEAHRTYVISTQLLLQYLLYATDDQSMRRRLVGGLEESSWFSSRSAGWRNTSWGYQGLLLSEGRWEELQRSIDEEDLPTLAVFRNTGRSFHARLHWYQGRTEDAWRIINELVPGGPRHSIDESMHFLQGEPHRIAAGLSLSEGNLEDARRWLSSHDNWLDSTGAMLGRSESSLLWSRLFLAEGNLGEAKECAKIAHALATRPMQPIAWVNADHLLGVLSMHEGDLDRAQIYLEDARKRAEACRLSFEMALTKLELARVEKARGNIDAARVYLYRARQTFLKLGATPSLLAAEQLAQRLDPHTPEPHFGLSRREREVLALIIQGETDKEIADELFISPRTVMSHVASILRKMNVDSRTAAAATAIRRQLL